MGAFAVVLLATVGRCHVEPAHHRARQLRLPGRRFLRRATDRPDGDPGRSVGGLDRDASTIRAELHQGLRRRRHEILPSARASLLFPFSKATFESREGPRLRPSSDLCRPPSRGNDLYENNRKITKDFYQRFLVPVTATLEDSLTTEVGEQSPILETLQLISRSQEIDDGGRKTLIVVSDMLQNTAAFNHYGPRRGYDDFVRSGFATDVKADFRDWNVIVIYLRRYRDRQLQQAAHIDFWQRYFHEAGAKITRWAAVD